MIKLLFPAFVLTKEYLGKDKCSEITPEYMVALKEEIDAMRKETIQQAEMYQTEMVGNRLMVSKEILSLFVH